MERVSPHPRQGRLYVVATPLGNLEDITLRALRVLRDVHLIACEDTRRAARLLAAHKIGTPTTSCFEHNERAKTPHIVAELQAGRDVALVSDAGTPCLSDPGHLLVREALSQGIDVIPVPGPSALAAALSVSGFPADSFRFVGFLPARPGERMRALEALASQREPLVFYETPVRVVRMLKDALSCLGEREVFMCREATKLHEEYRRSTLTALHAELAGRPVVRGELVLVVEGARRERLASTESPQDVFARLMAAGLPLRAAVKETARAVGLPAREVYARALSWRAGRTGNESA